MKTLHTHQLDIPNTLVDKLETFLGTKGVRFFRLIDQFHGDVSPVLRLHESRKHIPHHSIHSNEGMQIRNFMRRQSECKDWTCHDFDDNWARAVELIIRRHKSIQ